MADTISLSISEDGIKATLRAMLDRGQLTRGWLNRVAYPKIIEVQRMRWASENNSEGEQWKALNPKYAAIKLKKFRDYEGAGRKMLVATARLVRGMTGDNTADHYKLVEEKRLYVGTIITYAKYVNEDRNFTNLSQNTVDDLKDSLVEYLRNG